MNDARIDRLYELLPVIYRMRDAEQGEPLKALLQIISEQVNLVEDDIQQLYENWFIETSEDWVVPYLGDLIGYESVHEAGEPSPGKTIQGRLRNKILIPRREVANTIRYRRRKGSLALLEQLSHDIAGWPGRAVEFYKLLGWTQALNHLHLDRGRTVDIRNSSALKQIDSPFDRFAHSVDVRRINSHYSQGRSNIPSVGLFVWRLKSYSVTNIPAYCLESVGPHCFTFSILGNDSPLYMRPEPEVDPLHIADEFNLPVPIRRQFLEDNIERLYGINKSFYLLKGSNKTAVPIEQIQVADLTNWQYRPEKGKVAVDPELGRIVFPPNAYPRNGVWVQYQYGFSADLGGGEYTRLISQQTNPEIYQVGKGGDYKNIQTALKKWRCEQPDHAVIEIIDSGVYVEQVNINFNVESDEKENKKPDTKQLKSLQIRATNNQRPIIRLLDWCTSGTDSLSINGDCVACFTLDGILLTGRGMETSGDLTELTIRHSTLVPGWTIDNDCTPDRTEPSLEIFSPNVCVKIEHSIVGEIQVEPTIETLVEGELQKINAKTQCQADDREYRLNPIRICISDSILDATNPACEVLGAPDCTVAHAYLTIQRSTVFGHIQVHAIELAENSIFDGRITVARRQKGCVRFCYVTPESRTPRRYRCQPDLVKNEIEENLKKKAVENGDSVPDDLTIDAAKQQESLRVRPRFNSVRYGTPTYCQLADCCTEEIKRGAHDESEMGVFHDLFQPQRMANLRVRLDEYLPAHMDVGILVSS